MKVIKSIFETIKEFVSEKIQWFHDTSGLAKFIMVLCVLMTIINIGGNIYSANKANEAKVVISQKVEEQKDLANEVFSNLNMPESLKSFSEFFDGMGNIVKKMVVLFITIFVSLLVYYLCKPFDWFRKIAEIFAELDEDWWALKFILWYDVISGIFSIYTVYGIITC